MARILVVEDEPDIAGLLGRPTVMTFLYSTCEDTCPTQVQSIRGALDDGQDAAAILAFLGKKKFEQVRFVPTESVEQIKTDIETIKADIARVRSR